VLWITTGDNGSTRVAEHRRLLRLVQRQFGEDTRGLVRPIPLDFHHPQPGTTAHGDDDVITAQLGCHGGCGDESL